MAANAISLLALYDILAVELQRQSGELESLRKRDGAKQLVIDRLVVRVDKLESRCADLERKVVRGKVLAEAPPAEAVRRVRRTRVATERNNVVAIVGAKQRLSDYLDDGLKVCR